MADLEKRGSSRAGWRRACWSTPAAARAIEGWSWAFGQRRPAKAIGLGRGSIWAWKWRLEEARGRDPAFGAWSGAAGDDPIWPRWLALTERPDRARCVRLGRSLRRLPGDPAGALRQGPAAWWRRERGGELLWRR